MTTAHSSARRLALTLAALTMTLGTLGACGGDSDGDSDSAPEAPDSQPSESTSAPVVPTPQEDKAAIKAALLTPEDLGTPWIEPKKVNRIKREKGKGPKCVNHERVLEQAKARLGVDDDRSMTEGSKPGAAILTVWVSTLEPESIDAWRAAEEQSLAACSEVEAAPMLAVTEPVAAVPTIEGADEVVGAITRIYENKSKSKLLYVRHTFAARSGRAVTWVSLAFIQPKSDPDGSDTSKTVGFLTQQVAKVNQEIPE